MPKKLSFTLTTVLAGIGLSCLPCAHALVLSGPNGTGSGNATQSSLNSFITSNSLPSFPYWANVIPVSDASGVYLGDGWVMTAAHVSQLTVNVSTITVDGTAFTVRQNVPVGTLDVRLYRIGTGGGDPPLPALPSIGLDPSSPVLSQSFLTFGRGERAEGTLNLATSSDSQVSGSPSFFEWAGPGTVRWGSNSVEAIPVWTGAAPGPYAVVDSTTVFTSTMDDPGSGNYLTTNEPGHANGDSGGPLFSLQSGTWVLSGITLAVAADPATGQPGSTTGFGNITAYADMATHRLEIEGIIPEPSTVGLSLLGVTALLGRRKREQ